VPLGNPRTLKLFAVLLIGFFCQTMNGYDTMMFGGLLNNKEYFLRHFHGENKGIWAGLISSMYQIGGVSALPFVGPCIDQWGRRVGMFVGSILIIVGTIVQGLTSANASEGQMMGGRFVLGFGVTIAAAAGPIWVVETAHPKYRGIITGLCNTTWLAGSILSSGATRGGLDIQGNNSWLIPIWLQMFFPGIICIFAFFIPESPRWLYAHNKREKSKDVLTKWHGYGNPENAWVKLQLNEYEEYIELDGSVSFPYGSGLSTR
jgi:MFS family permease